MRLNGLRDVALAAAVVAVITAGCGGSTPESLVSSGKDYLAKNDTKAAVIQFKNALQENPKLAEARFLLGETLLDTGDYATAEKELRKALEYNYPADRVIPPLARSLTLLGQNKQVIEEFGKTEIAAPEGKAELQTALGKAYLAGGDVASARAAFTAALSAQQNYAPALVGLAQTTGIAGDYAKALTSIDSALAASPNFAEGWYVKGDILRAQGQRDSALAAYRKSLELQRDSVAAHSAAISLLVQENKLDEAGKQLELMKQALPRHPQTVYFQALLAYSRKDLVTARQLIQQQLSNAPYHLASLSLAGSIEYELKSYAVAETYLTRVLQTAPEHLQSRGMLALTYLRLGEPAKALSTIKPALGKIDKDPEMLGVAGETFMMNGDAEQAAAYFAKAAALDPVHKANRTALAMTYIARGDVQRGLRELEQTAAQDTDIRADMALIATYMQRREIDNALKAIANLEKKQPDSPAPHNLRGGMYLALKDAKGARRSFERALELKPTYFPAADNLARLDLAEGKPDAARQRFEAILAKEPNNLDALLALAQLRTRTEGPKASADVAALISRAITAAPNDVAPRLLLIAHHLRTKDPKKAVTAAQDALAVMPERPELIEAAGQAYQAAADFNQALTMYAKLASLQPNSAVPYMRMAQLHFAMKDKDAGAADLRKALSVQPDHVGAQRGVIALELEGGRQKEALAIAEDIQKRHPKDPAGYVFEGDIYAFGKQWNAAATAYRRGLKETRSTYLAARLHDVLLLSGDAGGAENFATAWFKDHSNDNAFRLHVAQTAMLRKDYGNATQQYRRLVNDNPNNASLLNNLALASSHLKDPKALQYAEQAYKLAPKHPIIMETLGTLLVQTGETGRGLELLREAAGLAPQSPEIRLSLAKAQIKAGQKDAARKELDELSKLGDKFPRQAEVKELKQEL